MPHTDKTNSTTKHTFDELLAKATPGPFLVEPLQSTNGADLAITGKGIVVAVVQYDPEIQQNDEECVDGGNVVWHPDQKPTAELIVRLLNFARAGGVQVLRDALMNCPGWNDGDEHGRPWIANGRSALAILDGGAS